MPPTPLSITYWHKTMELTGTPKAQISTPFGMVLLNPNGKTNVTGDTAVFIKERIAAGSLPDFELVDDEPTEPTSKTK